MKRFGRLVNFNYLSMIQYTSYYPMEEIQHEVRVLMTRGVNRLYIYACDPELQKALLRAEKER